MHWRTFQRYLWAGKSRKTFTEVAGFLGESVNEAGSRLWRDTWTIRDLPLDDRGSHRKRFTLILVLERGVG